MEVPGGRREALSYQERDMPHEAGEAPFHGNNLACGCLQIELIELLTRHTKTSCSDGGWASEQMIGSLRAIPARVGIEEWIHDGAW